jgi:hypothetical protein
MSGRMLDFAAEDLFEIVGEAAIDQLPCPVLSGQASDDAQPVVLGNIKQGSRRQSVRNSNGVESQRRHLGEVAVDLYVIRVFAALGVGGECAIGDPAHPKTRASGSKKLAVDLDPSFIQVISRADAPVNVE